MSNVLYITANPKAEEESYSLSVGRAFITAYKEANPDDRVVELDLYRTELPSLDYDIFSGWGKLRQGIAFSELSESEQSKISAMNTIADQFVAADKYVFATPMWNFSLPPAAKAYIDASRTPVMPKADLLRSALLRFADIYRLLCGSIVLNRAAD